jgi:hypothetical protein
MGKAKKNIYLCRTTRLPKTTYITTHYMSSDTSKRYAQRGVSGKEDVHNAIKILTKLFPQAFCKIVPDYLTQDEYYCLICMQTGRN